jgi:signal transduction histidine kinase
MLKGWLKNYSQGPKLLQLGFYWIIIVVLFIFIFNYPADLTLLRFIGTVTSLSLLLILNIVWNRPSPEIPSRLHTVQEWSFLILSAALILIAAWLSKQNEVIYLVTFVCAQASFRQGLLAGLIFGAINLLLWFGYQLLLQANLTTIIATEAALMTGIVSVLLLMTLLNRYIQQTRRAEALLNELQVANAKLAQAAEKEKELAIAEERVRLARDIHDGLGHHLTSLKIQLQVASKLVERNPQAAAQAIQVCQAEAHQALEDVRNSVSLMRQPLSEKQALEARLNSLVNDFQRNTQLSANFDCSGDPLELSAFIDESLYRTAQEGLTNVQKHALGASQVSVRLFYEPAAVRLSVEDDGKGPDQESTSPETGFGLVGLRERAGKLGGGVTSGYQPGGGFKVETHIPLERDSS